MHYCRICAMFPVHAESLLHSDIILRNRTKGIAVFYRKIPLISCTGLNICYKDLFGGLVLREETKREEF